MLLQDHVFTLETSTPNAGRKISASFTRNGVVYEKSDAVAAPITGAYDAFTSRNVAVVLEAGVQVLRLTFGGGNDQDLRSFSIVLDRAGRWRSNFCSVACRRGRCVGFLWFTGSAMKAGFGFARFRTGAGSVYG